MLVGLLVFDVIDNRTEPFQRSESELSHSSSETLAFQRLFCAVELIQNKVVVFNLCLASRHSAYRKFALMKTMFPRPVYSHMLQFHWRYVGEGGARLRGHIILMPETCRDVEEMEVERDYVVNSRGVDCIILAARRQRGNEICNSDRRGGWSRARAYER